MKFKVFDTKKKEFVSEKEFWLLSDGILDNPYQYCPKDRFIPIYSTGLLDKNQVEIYEGDIIRHPSTGIEGEVSYKNGVISYYDAGYMITFKYEGKIRRQSANRSLGWEIIGSKYTNPDLTL